MLQLLHQITPLEVKRRLFKPPPEYQVPFHRPFDSKWNYVPQCFVFNNPKLRDFMMNSQNGLILLFSNCIHQETSIHEVLKKHLSDNLIPYLLLIFLSSPTELESQIEFTLPGNIKRFDPSCQTIRGFIGLFVEHLAEETNNNILTYQNLFATIQHFYQTLYHYIQLRNEALIKLLLSRLGHHPSYLSPIQTRRLLIYTHLSPDITHPCNKLLKRQHPPIILNQRFPKDLYLRPDEWKTLTQFLPAYLSPKARGCVERFKHLLYPVPYESNPLFEFPIPPGGGCGWTVPGVDQCLIQFMTFLQPNWMELWAAMRWNMCVEMQKRLRWLNETEFEIKPDEILSILFCPD